MVPLFPDLTQGYDLIFGTHSTISSDTDTDSSAIDLQDYDGPVHVFASIGNSGDASTTIAIKLVEATTSGGTYTAITGASKSLSASASANDNTTHMIKVDNWQKRYVKTRVTTAGGGTASVPIAVMVLARKKRGGGSGIKTVES